MDDQGHPIEVDLEKLLPLLASEIYTSPFAFLRENVQNAFDAVRMQRYRDQSEGVSKEHRIQISLEGNRLSISDTGIGMTKRDLESFFWSIGKSGKHTDEAKRAGVVGTFGIGGMANFGICSRVEIVTRTHDSSEAVYSFAEKATLSAKDDCVFYGQGPDTFEPGTTVTGTLYKALSEQQVIEYLEPITQYVDVPIFIGDELLPKKLFPSVERDEGASHVVTSGQAKADVWIRALQNGQAEIEVQQLTWNGVVTDVSAVFSTAEGVVCAFQHGFMLASVPLTTIFGLGGAINSSVLRPTAGREAVTDDSRTLAQHLLVAVESGLAAHIANTPGLPERFSSFYRYISKHGQWQLAGSATVRKHGESSRVRLDSMKSLPRGRVFFTRDGHDQAIMHAYGEQGKTIVILSSDGHRQKVESNYLTAYCNATQLADSVTCLRVIDRLSLPEDAFRYQLLDRLRRQYLVDGLHIRSGELSHGAMLWVSPSSGSKEKTVFIDFRHPHIKRLLEHRNRLSFDAVFDIFIRDSVFPHLESAFPELKKRDFDTLLRALQSTVEYFEIDPGDISRMQHLASFTMMSPEDIAAVFGGQRAGSPRTTSINRTDVGNVTPQINRVVEQSAGKSPDEIRRDLEILLLETELDSKILDASGVQPQIGLARFYLALTKDAHVLYRRIFLERKPSADFSWGGHRAGYLFYGSGSAVVYYDIQFEDLIGDTEHHDRSGQVTLEYPPILLKNQVFLPIPKAFEPIMIPKSTTLRFTVRHQILGVDPLDHVAD